MQKFLGAALAAMTISGAAQAGEWSIPATISDGFKAEPTIALIGGLFDPEESGADSDSLVGIELSMNCPLIQPPSNRIRQQVSLARFDDQGTELTTLEINPHYVLPVGSNMELGFGPGFGVMWADNGVADHTLYTLQAGVSLHYRRGAFFFGGEARYQITTEEDFGAGKSGVDNTRLLLKVGMDI